MNMQILSDILLGVLALECGALLIWGLAKRGRIYEFPFLAAVVFSGFILVQVIGLRFYSQYDQANLERFLLMCVLCLPMCYIGYMRKFDVEKKTYWTYDLRRLQILGVVYTLVGLVSYAMLRSLLSGYMHGAWEGQAVAINFFVAFSSYGLVVCIHCYLRSNKVLLLLLVLLNSLVYLDLIVSGGQRAVAAELFLIWACSLWFVRRRLVPRYLFVAFAVLGWLFVVNVAEYRAAIGSEAGDRWSKVVELQLFANAQRFLEEGGSEVKAGSAVMAGIESELGFDFGTFHWNSLIFNYVPRQLVGYEFKQSLMIDIPDIFDAAYRRVGYDYTLGTTITGIADSFCSFWYAGCVKFFLIALIMGYLYRRAKWGSLTAQILYCLLLVSALEAFTHTTHRFVGPMPHMLLFLLPGLLYARSQKHMPVFASRLPTAGLIESSFK